MKKTKKLFLFLVIVIINIGINVYAGTNDSILVRNQIDGIYAIAPLSDRTHLYNLEIYKMNGKTSYCIEIGKKITSETYNSTDNTNEQQAITNLTKEQLEYIKAISYFGYEYSNHTDIKYYMASQELIWEYLNNIDITWTNELNINGQRINIDTYKEEINNLATRYIKALSLPTSEAYTIGTTHTLTDNSLEFYNVSSKNNNPVTISGNNLNITINTNSTKKDTITLTRKNYYNESAKIYNFNDSQIMLSAGNLKKLEHNIEVYIMGATLRIELIDKDTREYKPSGQAVLEGSEYELYDESNKLLYTFTFSNLNFFLYANLSYGKYYIKQKTPGKGYQKENQKVEVIIDKLNKNIVLEEEVIKNKIEINKLYEYDSKNKREKDITFLIYDNNNNIYTSITTTETGPDILTLPYGKYTMKQQNTTYGYKMINDIEINIENQNNTIIKYNLLDERIKTKVQITTKEKESKNKIEEKNITYKILNIETNNYVYYINEKGKKIYDFKTNELGEVLLPVELPYGTYKIEQITQPTNYLKTNEKIEIIINEESEYKYINDEPIINIDYYNIKKPEEKLNNNAKNPKTIDNINHFFYILIISILSIIFIKIKNK